MKYLKHGSLLLLGLLEKLLAPPSGTHISVLVFIDSMEIERLVVDKELGAGHINSANTDWQSVHIFVCRSLIGCHQANLEVEVNK